MRGAKRRFFSKLPRVLLLALVTPSVVPQTASAAALIRDIGTLGDRNSFAYSINDSGEVVGDSELPQTTLAHAFLWRNGHMADLVAMTPAPPEPIENFFSHAYGINDSGQVVGWYTHDELQGEFTHVTSDRAFLWNDGIMTLLGTLGGTYSRAYGINASGQVVG